MKPHWILALSAAVLLVAACSHPLEIVGEGDIVDSQGIHGCTFEQFNTPASEGKHPCPNLVVGDYHVDYMPVPKPGWRFVGWGNYCEGSTQSCPFDVDASVVVKFWGKTVLPLVAHFEPITGAEEFLTQVLNVGASAAIYRESDSSFLVTTTAANGASQGALIRIDTATGEATTLAPLEYLALVIELSHDQQTLYISYANKNRIDVFDLIDNNVVASIDLGRSTNGASQLFANSISASPTDPGVIAVTTGRGFFPAFLTDSYRIALYRDGAQLGESITSYGVPRKAAFSPDGTVLYGEQLTSIDITTHGLGDITERYSGSYVDTPKFVGDMVFSHNWALDPETLLHAGTYPTHDNLIANTQAAYAPDLDYVYFYAYEYDRLLVHDARRFTPVANYSLTLPGTFRGLQASTSGLLLFTDKSVYLFAEERIEPMFTEGCPTHTLTEEIGRPYLRLDCRISEVIQDPFRDKLYASVAGSLGENGNSIAIIDSQSGLIEQFIPTVSQPRHLALSADGSKLWVSSAVTNFVHRVDLATQAIDGRLSIDTEFDNGSSEILGLLAHPVDASTFVVVQGYGGMDQKLVSVSDMSRTDLLHYFFSYGRAVFADDGRLVVSRSVDFTRVVEEFEVTPTGFASVKIGYPVPEDAFFYTSFISHGDALVRDDGLVFDRDSLAQLAPVPLGDDFTGIFSTASDPMNGTFYHGSRRSSASGNLRLLRFDFDTRELSGTQEFHAMDIFDAVRSIHPLANGNVGIHVATYNDSSEDTYLYFLRDADFAGGPED